MKSGLSREALHVLAQIPDHPVPATALFHTASPAGVRYLLRRLMDAGLVAPTSQRPLAVRIVSTKFVLNLRDYTQRNRKNTTLLAGATLPVLAVLAAQTDRRGISIDDISHEAAVHANTARASLRRLRDRGFITLPEAGRYRLVDRALTERDLGRAYAQHRLQQRTPPGARRVIDVSPLVRVIEADDDLGLPLTAVSRFQVAGADVVAPMHQLRVHAFRDDEEVSMEVAMEDARRLNTAPRTLRAMEAFLHD